MGSDIEEISSNENDATGVAEEAVEQEFDINSFSPVLCNALNLSQESSFENDFTEVLVRRGVGRTTFNDCLAVFNKHGIGNFSSDARSCVGSLRKVDTVVMAPGRYFHFGLKTALNDALQYITLDTNCSELRIQVNVDGLPISRSSNLSFWPILCRLIHPLTSNVFMVGIYCGLSKPESVDDYMSFFLDDLKTANSEGMVVNGKSYAISIHSIVCDAPARQFLKCIKGHTAYGACERCTVNGIHYYGRRYLSTECALRDNSSFRLFRDTLHHLCVKSSNQHIVSPLCSTSLDMVKDFPLDYMHLVLLGVVRRFLKIWLGVDVGKSLIRKFHRTVISVMNARQTLFTASVPLEFQRKPRSFEFVAHFKASEFRTFLCYTSPAILHGLFDADGVLYGHFMCLVVALRILLSPCQSQENVAFSRNCLKMFVKKVKDLYGIAVLVYNVHCVIHIADDYDRFGCLDSISCFPFESFMQTLKGYLTRNGKELEQVVKRYHEQKTFGLVGSSPKAQELAQLNGLHFNGPLGPYLEDEISQYSEVKYQDRVFRLNSPNAVVCRESSFFRILNILQVGSHVVFLANRFEKVDEEVFLYPCKSSAVGINYCAVKLIPRVIEIHVSEVVKCWFTPIDERKALVVKLLHDV